MKRLVINATPPIAFHREIAQVFGILEALYIQQLYYWSDKGIRKDGYIYKTKAELSYETCLTIRQQDRIRKRLEKDGLLETKLLKANGVPTLHYKLNIEKIQSAIQANDKDIPIIQNVRTQYDETSHSNVTKRHIPYTEITTKITTDKKHYKEKSPKTKKEKKKKNFHQPTIDDLDDDNPPQETSTSLSGFEIESFFRKLVLHSTKNFAKLNSELDILEVYRKHGKEKLLELMSLAEQAPDRWEGTEYTDSVLKRFIDHLSGNLKLDKKKPKPKKEIKILKPDTKIIANGVEYTIREMSGNGIIYVVEDYTLLFRQGEYEVKND